MSRTSFCSAAASLAMAFWIAGCGSPAPTSPAPGESPPSTAGTHNNPADHVHGEHDHPAEGPHHGDLVELGADEFHAEVLHGDDGAVTVYILDGAAKAATPIDATEVTFNVVHNGQPEQFQLPADPDSTDPAGQSSRFSLTDAALAKHLSADGTTAKLSVTINGTSYSGLVEHHHDHDHADGHQH